MPSTGSISSSNICSHLELGLRYFLALGIPPPTCARVSLVSQGSRSSTFLRDQVTSRHGGDSLMETVKKMHRSGNISGSVLNICKITLVEV